MSGYVYRGSQTLKQAAPKKTRPDAPPCTVEDCDKHAHARGYCETHYYHHYKKPSKEAGHASSST